MKIRVEFLIGVFLICSLLKANPFSPPLGVPFLVDSSIIMIPREGDEHTPSVAFDGEHYLVAWQTEPLSYYGYRHIYFTRILQDGTILDPNCVPIPQSYGSAFPDVAYGGSCYLAVWVDLGSKKILGARITSSGDALDSNPFVVNDAFYVQEEPNVVYGGSKFLVSWTDYRDGPDADIYFTFVTLGGEVLYPDGRRLSVRDGLQWHSRATYLNGKFLVVWEDWRSGAYPSIYGSRVTIMGSIMDPEGHLILRGNSSYKRYPDVSSDGNNYLLVWTDYRNSSIPSIYGAFLSQDLEILPDSEFLISDGEHPAWFPRVVFKGTNYLVTWIEAEDSVYKVRAKRIGLGGEPLDSIPIVVSEGLANQIPPGVAGGENSSLIAWEDISEGLLESNIVGKRISNEGELLDSNDVILSNRIPEQDYGRAAYNGENYLVVWSEYRDDWDIYGTLLDENGTPLQSEPFPICKERGDQKKPWIDSDGSNFFVVWEDYRTDSLNPDIYGARVTNEGEVLDSTGIPILTGEEAQINPRIKFGNSIYTMVWEEYQENPDSTEVKFTQITTNGEVIIPSGVFVSDTLSRKVDPSISFDGGNFFIAWGDYRSGNGRGDIYGCRIDETGTILDPKGFMISHSEDDNFMPTVTFGRGQYALVWVDRPWGTWHHLYGNRVSPAGTVIDSEDSPIYTEHLSKDYPILSFDGEHYIVLWQDLFTNTPHGYNIYGAWLSTSMETLWTFALKKEDKDDLHPFVVHGNGINLLTLWQGWSERPYRTNRIWGEITNYTGVQESLYFIIGPSGFKVFPNPFKDKLNLEFSIRNPGRVTIEIFDPSGRLIETLLDKNLPQGLHRLEWNFENQRWKIPQGLYFLYLRAPGSIQSKRVALFK